MGLCLLTSPKRLPFGPGWTNWSSGVLKRPIAFPHPRCFEPLKLSPLTESQSAQFSMYTLYRVNPIFTTVQCICVTSKSSVLSKLVTAHISRGRLGFLVSTNMGNCRQVYLHHIIGEMALYTGQVRVICQRLLKPGPVGSKSVMKRWFQLGHAVNTQKFSD